MCLISVADPALNRRLVWRPPVVPSNLAFLTILWSSMGCEDESVWAGHGLLGGGRKTSAHGSEAAAFIHFGAGSRGGKLGPDYSCQLAKTELPSIAEVEASTKRCWAIASTVQGEHKGFAYPPNSCWKLLVWKAGLDDRTYWKQTVLF